METKDLVRIPAGRVFLEGELVVPDRASGLVIFAHGAGSSRLSPRNIHVAGLFQKQGLATLLFDLLTEEEDRVYSNRFDIDLLSRRMADSALWTHEHAASRDLSLGFFGASTGSAAALMASVLIEGKVRAIVSRGGRPDMVLDVVPRVDVPTLFIVGGKDELVIEFNIQAYNAMTAEKDLKIVEGAGHLFEEPGKLDEVASLAGAWFRKYLS